MIRVLLVVWILPAAALAAEPGERAAPPGLVIGVYMQPVESFDAWRARGINTLVGYESRSGSTSNRQWSQAAAAKGFYYLRAPGDDLSADRDDDRLLAWMHDDEPDRQDPPTDPRQLQRDFARWKAAAADKPVFINFSGRNVLDARASRSRYLAYLSAADWIGSDFYPVSGFARPDWLWKVGAAVDRLGEWSGGKPRFCFIETSNQRLAWMPATGRGVTADELRALVWHGVIHGVRGIIYFPQQLGDKRDVPFRYDATPRAVRAEMTVQNRRLAELAAVLGSPANPPEITIRARSPVEVGWRIHDNSMYVIALNFADQDSPDNQIHLDGLPSGAIARELWTSRRITLDGKPIHQPMSPYEVKVYRIALRG